MGRGLSAQPEATPEIQPEVGQGTMQRRQMDRRGFLACAIAAISAGACRRLDELFPREGNESEPTGELKTASSGNLQLPSDPAEADKSQFLDKELVELKGLALLLAQPDMDRYIFSSVTGNKAFTNVANVKKSKDFPYHAFLFKAFDPKSNVNLPDRLGRVDKRQSLADFFNGVTRFNGTHSGHVGQIKTILVASYEFSFGIKLDPDYIEVVVGNDGKISAIKYTAEGAQQLEGKVQVAVTTAPDSKNQEIRQVTDSKEETHKLVDRNGNLIFPPSTSETQGIAIPPDALPNHEVVRYKQEFSSQDKIISIDIDIPIAAILDEREKLKMQNRPRSFNLPEHLIQKNPAWYILNNDPFVKRVAETVTGQFQSPREKMQAILDFVQSYHYVPDSYGDTSKTPLMSLICRGGDCEDSSILSVALARAIGIDCVFTYFPGHVATACQLKPEPGDSYMQIDGKYYLWMEQAGNAATNVTVNKADEIDPKLVHFLGVGFGHKIGQKPQQLPTHISTVDGSDMMRMNWPNL